MKKHVTIAVVVLAAVMAACSGGEKKVVIMASGKLTVNDKDIKLDPGFTHNEEEITFKGDKITLNVESTDGTKKTFDLTDNGVYLLNLQKDTLIGGLVNYGATGIPSSITEEQLSHLIDSTQQLMEGKNASDATRTYFLPPYTVKKVSAEPNAKLVGSFKGIPASIDADASGKTPEVFKFYTNSQKRETLNELLGKQEKLKHTTGAQ